MKTALIEPRIIESAKASRTAVIFLPRWAELADVADSLSQLCPDYSFMVLDADALDACFAESSDYSVEGQIYELIQEHLTAQGQSDADTVVIGMAEEAYTAVLYGAQHNFHAVISLGSSWQPSRRPACLLKAPAPRMPHGHAEDIAHFEGSRLRRLISNGNSKHGNYYVFQADPAQPASPALEILDQLAARHNVNIIRASSERIRNEIDLCLYKTSMVASLLNSLAHGIAPRIGYISSGDRPYTWMEREQILNAQRSSRALISDLHPPELKNDRLYPQGYAAIRGYAAQGYGSQNVTLHFHDGNDAHKYPMGSLIRADLSKKLYKQLFIDYSATAFASARHEGISLAELPDAAHTLELSVLNSGTELKDRLGSGRPFSRFSVHEGNLYQLVGDYQSTTLTKRSLPGARHGAALFRLEEAEIRGNRFVLRGAFAVEGIQLTSETDHHYILTLQDGDTASSYELASHHLENGKPEDWQGDYGWAGFSTGTESGLELGSLPASTFTAHVSLYVNGLVYSEPLDVNIEAQAVYAALGQDGATASRPSVSVLGSCVSRDNFNSRIMPDWRSFFELGPVHYQMSLVSLMSPAMAFDHPDFALMNDHDRQVTERDFSKVFKDEISTARPDVLVVDLFADARFSCIQYLDGFITDNVWKLPTAPGFYSSLDSTMRVGLEHDRDQFLFYFENACLALQDFLKQNSPHTVVVLNSARAVFEYNDSGRRAWFAREGNVRLNENWQQLEEIFVRIFKPIVLSSMTAAMQSDKHHPWGPASVHYEKLFYRRFRQQLLQKLGYTAEFSLQADSATGVR
ncbi:DUF6270 domain-containing protein [Arthrobacter sp. NPDC089319]|uniref:DUF6270 domain-containing protein n=1 Tax=Arthrobacter sp. NPDC089319 TaxID=3155915 RepID=UPI0034160790